MIADLLNVSEAAKVIGCTESRVRQMLRDGLLNGVKANAKAWLVPESEAKKMAETQQPTGRPRKSKNQT